MGSLSIWHWMIVIVVVLLLFGRNKISDLMGDVAGGIKAFKRGMAEDDTPPAVKDPKTIDSKTIDHKAQASAQASAQPSVQASTDPADAKARADS
jgi:sec-independent protein translocase protein TatA